MAEIKPERTDLKPEDPKAPVVTPGAKPYRELLFDQLVRVIDVHMDIGLTTKRADAAIELEKRINEIQDKLDDFSDLPSINEAAKKLRKQIRTSENLTTTFEGVLNMFARDKSGERYAIVSGSDSLHALVCHDTSQLPGSAVRAIRKAPTLENPENTNHWTLQRSQRENVFSRTPTSLSDARNVSIRGTIIDEFSDGTKRFLTVEDNAGSRHLITNDDVRIKRGDSIEAKPYRVTKVGTAELSPEIKWHVKHSGRSGAFERG